MRILDSGRSSGTGPSACLGANTEGHIRAGVHSGECERIGDKIAGVAVVIGARVMNEAGPDEVFCSRTVKDLVGAGGFRFEDRGMRALKGVPDGWQLFGVTR